MRPTAVLQLVILCVLGCSGSYRATGVSEKIGFDEPRAQLPDWIAPVRYRATLEVDPAQPMFRGSIEIDVELARASDFVWLHARGLSIESVEARVGDASYEVSAEQRGTDFLLLRTRKPLPVGLATLTFSYSGTAEDEKTEGLYRVQEPDGSWFAYTIFEADMARRVFPLFDEPRFKVPWTLSFRVAGENRAFANQPLVETRQLDDGSTLVVTKETPPLPSYLIAFAVGPFDVVEAGSVGENGVPLRFLVPPGRRDELSYARSTTPTVVAELERFFAMPYPFEKLDVAVVPRYWGTMEHPGIVAMGQSLSLIKPAEDSPRRRLQYANILAHELCHYWFGDYVTMRWWDDLYLNESFGTWCDMAITDKVGPQWEVTDALVTRRDVAARADILGSAKRIREPIPSASSVEDSFDSQITYSKGASVIAMFEAFVGTEEFRGAIRGYLDDHEWGIATTDSFVASMDARLPGLGTAMRTFIEKPGIPLVTMELSCPKGKAPSLQVEQQRLVPPGSTADRDVRYHVPVCVRYRADGASGRACHLLKEEVATIELPAASCPDAFVGNSGGAGYYRVRYRGDLIDRAFAASFDGDIPFATTNETNSLANDVTVLFELGEVGVDKALAMAPRLVGGGSVRTRYGLGLAETAVEQLDERQLESPQVQAYFRALIGPRLQQLGVLPKDGEEPEIGFERNRLVRAFGNYVHDPDFRGRALSLVTAHLDGTETLRDDSFGVLAPIAARVGGQALFERLEQAARSADDHRMASRYFRVLGAFREPALADRALAIVLETELDLRDTGEILGESLAARQTRQRAWDFVRAHVDELAARFTGVYLPGYLISPLEDFCEPGRRDEFEAFWRPRIAAYRQALRPLDEMLERLDVCVASRQRLASQVEAYFARP